MIIRRKAMNRRTFLRGAGGVALSLPLLEAMIPTVSAQSPTPPKRMIIFFTPNGKVMSQWGADGSENQFQLRQTLHPLEPHKSDLIVLNGVDMTSSYNGPGSAHPAGASHLLTGIEAQEGDLFDAGGETGVMGWGGGISIDQHIANAVGTTTRFKSLEFGVRRTGAQIRTRINYAGAAQPIPPESDPYVMYQRLFDAQGGADLGDLRIKRQSIIDYVLEDYARLIPRLGAADRIKVNAHLEAIHQIEQSLIPNEGGQNCEGPDLGAPINIQNQDNLPTMGRLQMDLIAQALACDLTRVCTLQWVAPVFTTTYGFLGHVEDHHSLSHAGLNDVSSQNKLAQIDTFYSEQLAYLINALKSIPEGEGTVFDQTVIWACSEIGHARVHDRNNMPFLLAGSCGGYFRTGRHLQFESVPHNNLHVSLMNAMGVMGNTFGNPAYCSGPLSGLT
jgi:hypothetical protein